MYESEHFQIIPVCSTLRYINCFYYSWFDFIKTYIVKTTKMFPDEMTEDQQQKGFDEIAWLFADWKITTEEACELFNEWIEEWKPLKN